jgi:hypothetical protein
MLAAFLPGAEGAEGGIVRANSRSLAALGMTNHKKKIFYGA